MMLHWVMANSLPWNEVVRMSGRLEVESGADRTVVRLSHVEKARNAIDAELVAELHAVCGEIEQNPRMLILSGSGGDFAAGADISQLRDRDREAALLGINSGLFERVARLPLPTIAAVEGYALGAGAELSYACDFRIATPSARFGNPEPTLGIMAAAGACWRLQALVGESLAKEMLLAGRVITGEEATKAGLVSSLHEPADLHAAAHALVDKMMRFDLMSLRLTKAVFSAPREAHPLIDNVAEAILFESPEKHTRMTKFLERKSAHD